MTDEQPYPAWNDSKALDELLSLALELIEVDRARGDVLYEIFKYLETRLAESGPRMEELDGDPQGDSSEVDAVHQATLTDSGKQDTQEKNEAKVVYVFKYCNIDRVIVGNTS